MMRGLLFAVSFVAIGAVPAIAQSPSCNPATLFKGLKPQTFMASLQACAADDVAAVIADANTEPKDFQALACVQPLQGIVQAKAQGGLLLAFQRFRRAKQSGFLTACTAWVNSVMLP